MLERKANDQERCCVKQAVLKSVASYEMSKARKEIHQHQADLDIPRGLPASENAPFQHGRTVAHRGSRVRKADR